MPETGRPDSHTPPPGFAAGAIVGSEADYQARYRRSVEDPDGFWREEAGRLDWSQPFERVSDVSFDLGDVHIRWFLGGKTNLCHNALDRHVAAGRGDRVAFIVEPDEPGEPSRTVTYADALAAVRRWSAVLLANGVSRGDRVTIYLP